MPRVVPSQVVELIDQLFPQARIDTEGSKKIHLSQSTMFQVAGILNLVEQIPPELIILTPGQFSEYETSVASMKTMLDHWRFQGDRGYTVIPGLRQLSPVTLIRQALSLCHDEFPPTDTTELSFISDEEFEESLRIDYSAVNEALSNGEWKAATVLAGSVVEALLLWSLQQCSRSNVSSAVANLIFNNTLNHQPRTNLEEWFLPELIEVAKELNLIKEDTAIQARLAKDYRNLIHPGRAQRLGQICDRGTALAAVAALERVVTDLKP
jgi:hypothetical protein